MKTEFTASMADDHFFLSHSKFSEDSTFHNVAESVELHIDPALPENDIRCEMKVTDRFGATHAEHVIVPLGSPAKPVSQSGLIDKFIDCAGYASQPIPAAQARQICDAALALESIRDVARDFMPHFAASEPWSARSR